MFFKKIIFFERYFLNLLDRLIDDDAENNIATTTTPRGRKKGCENRSKRSENGSKRLENRLKTCFRMSPLLRIDFKICGLTWNSILHFCM